MCLATAVPDQSDRVQCGDDVCLTTAVPDHAGLKAQCGDDVCLAIEQRFQTMEMGLNVEMTCVWL